MDLLRRFSSTAKSPTDEESTKVIVYRGGVVTFRIPAHWKEEYSDVDGGMFYDDRFESGTLRLNVTTLSSGKELKTDSAIQILRSLKQGEGTPLALANGNALLRYQQTASDKGKRLSIYYWIIVNPLPPLHARVATFSYTILEQERDSSPVARDLQMLEAEIQAAEFSLELGI
jgi:hypothetical protein